MKNNLKFIISILLIIIIIISCGNSKKQNFTEKTKNEKNYTDYEKGIINFEKGYWVYSKEYFLKVNSNDSNFKIAQEKIKICNEKIKEQEKEENIWLKSKAGKYYKFCQSKQQVVSKEDCERAATGEIWIGMNYWLLVAKMGNPNSINPSNYGKGNQYQYCWHNWSPSCYYDKDDDNLIDSWN